MTNDDDQTDESIAFNISEQYDDGDVYYGCDELEADIYIEEVKATSERIGRGDAPRGATVGDTYYAVGIFDRTIGSHPVVPGADQTHRKQARAICYALTLAANLQDHLERFRSRADYLQAKSLEDDGPALEGDGGYLPEFKLRQEQNRVFSGSKSVKEALSDLEESAENRTPPSSTQ